MDVVRRNRIFQYHPGMGIGGWQEEMAVRGDGLLHSARHRPDVSALNIEKIHATKDGAT